MDVKRKGKKPKRTPKHPCECTDPRCPVHEGKSQCTNAAKECLRRTDMVDKTGTLMCYECGEDMRDAVPCYHDTKVWIQRTSR